MEHKKGENTIKTVIEILDKFKGEIGVLLGAFAGALIDRMLKNMGKLKIYLRCFEKRYDTGYINGKIKTQEGYFDEAKECKLSLEFDIINTSENPKIMRDLKIVVKDGNKCEKTLVKDVGSRKPIGPFYEYDELKGLCIQGKEYLNISIYSFIFNEIEVNELKNVKLYLSYVNEKNKEKKIKIKID